MSDPNGCRWCGRICGEHGLYFTPSIGNHFFELPSDAQRLERMRERRAATTGESDDR